MFLEIEQPKAMSEIIEWHEPGEQLPDAETTVLIIMGGEVDAWMGYFEGERWVDVTGFPIAAPIYWAHLPEGPAA